MSYTGTKIRGIPLIKGIPQSIQNNILKNEPITKQILTNLTTIPNELSINLPKFSNPTESSNINLSNNSFSNNSNNSFSNNSFSSSTNTPLDTPDQMLRHLSAPDSDDSKNKLSLNARSFTETGKLKKTKSKAAIIHQIFEKCSMVTTDEFWIDLFTKASLGKFKRGFSFKDNYLIFNKNKDKMYLDADPIRAFNQCLYFFKTKAGIQSETDKLMERKIMESKMNENQKNIEEYTWSDFKKSKTRELFINEYINTCVSKYALSTNEKAQLKHIINYGLVLGCFGVQNIEFQNIKIQNIKGLLFDAEKRIFSISPEYTPKKKATAKSVKANGVVPLFVGKYISLTDKWHKFLGHFDNKVVCKHDYNEKFEKSGSTMFSKAAHSEE